MSFSSEDIELASQKKEYPNGFASVAAFIARDPDNTTTIFRRFDRIAARNLLHLQSKLQKLEAELDKLDAEVLHTAEENSKRAATSWEDFETLAKTEENERRRMETAEEMEKAVKAYRE